MNLDFPIVANNTVPVLFTVFQQPSCPGAPVGQPVNITGFTIKWQVFNSQIVNGVLVKVGAALITKSTGAGNITLSNPTIGQFTVSIAAADTVGLAQGGYIHEAVTVDGSGNPVTIVNNDSQISAGTMFIRQQYTPQ